MLYYQLLDTLIKLHRQQFKQFHLSKLYFEKGKLLLIEM